MGLRDVQVDGLEELLDVFGVQAGLTAYRGIGFGATALAHGFQLGTLQPWRCALQAGGSHGPAWLNPVPSALGWSFPIVSSLAS